MERRHLLLQVQAARVPEDLRREAPGKQAAPWGPLRPSGGGAGEGSFLQDLLSCDKGRDTDECVPEQGGNEAIWWTLRRSRNPVLLFKIICWRFIDLQAIFITDVFRYACAVSF